MFVLAIGAHFDDVEFGCLRDESGRYESLDTFRDRKYLLCVAAIVRNFE